MTFKPFSKIRTGNVDIDRIQDAIAASINPVLSNETLDNNILTKVSLTAGKDNIVNHGLGRDLQGWKIIRIRAESIIWDKQDTNPSPNKTLVLWCSADCVVDIEVF